MAFARTVLGDIAPEELGVVYAHEHLVIHGGRPVQLFPDFQLADVDKAVAELAPAQALGLRTVVDAMPADCGRDVLMLAEIARRSGVHVIAPSGLHHERYYHDRHWTREALGRRDRRPLRGRHRGRHRRARLRRAHRQAHRAPGRRHEDRRLDRRPERPRREGLRRRRHGPAPHRLPHPHPLRGRHGGPRAGRRSSSGTVATRPTSCSHTWTRSSTAPTSATSPPPAPVSSTTRASAGATSPTARSSCSSGRPRTVCWATSRWASTPLARATGRSSVAAPGWAWLLADFAAMMRERGLGDAEQHILFVEAPGAAFSFGTSHA